MIEEPEDPTTVPTPNATGETNPTSYTYHERIVDRTGELLKAAVETAEGLQRVQTGLITDPLTGEQAHVCITRDGVEKIPPSVFDEYRRKPVRRKGSITVTRLDSLIAVTNRFKSADSVIYASDNPASPHLTTVFNYHPAGDFDRDANFGDHRCIYAFPLSLEWGAWFGQNAKPMTMTDFAQFLEDHIVDVLAEPGNLGDAAEAFVAATGGKFATPSKLIEIARNLQVNESSVIKEARNLTSGEAEITFDTQHTGADGKPLKFPNLFVIAIPVFARSSVAYRLIARLRYRKQGGSLLFWYELWRPDMVLDNAIDEAVATVTAETGLPVYMGKPEA